MVDDEQELASLYKEFFIEMGLDAVSFTSPSFALEHYEQCPDKYSMILTDLRMPGMSGLELASRIRQLNSTVKIYLITAFDLSDVIVSKNYQEAKIDKVLQKPLKLSTLKNLIQLDLPVLNIDNEDK